MVHVELMIFDFDGTLVSSGEDIVNSVNFMLGQLNLPERNNNEILGFIGDGVDVLIEKSLGSAGLGKFDEAMRLFSRHYESHLMDATELYPGVHKTLLHFREKKKLIVTNKRYRFTVKIAEELGILSFFDDVIGRDNHDFVKPDSRLLVSIMEKFHVPAKETVVIGDGINDLILAKGAGALSCAYLNGLTPREILINHQPDFTYETIQELVNIFD